MKPHNENIEEYRKLCRERTNKSMIKNRQIQVGIQLIISCMLLHKNRQIKGGKNLQTLIAVVFNHFP